MNREWGNTFNKLLLIDFCHDSELLLVKITFASGNTLKTKFSAAKNWKPWEGGNKSTRQENQRLQCIHENRRTPWYPGRRRCRWRRRARSRRRPSCKRVTSRLSPRSQPARQRGCRSRGSTARQATQSVLPSTKESRFLASRHRSPTQRVRKYPEWKSKWPISASPSTFEYSSS